MHEANHLGGRLRAPSLGREDMTFAETPEGRRVDFTELWQGAQRIAAALVAAGVEPGDRVAAQVEKSPEALEVYLGAVLAGGAFLPLNPAYSTREVAYFLSDAEPAVLVADPARAEALAPVADDAGVGARFTLGADGAGTLAEAAEVESPGFAGVAREADDLAAILYTSGTTGRAKGAMLSHGNLVSNAEALAGLWRFDLDDVLIHALPIFHTHGLFVATNVALLAGAGLRFHARFDADAVLADFADATALMGVPTFYARLLDRPGLTRKAAEGVRLFVSGSAPLSPELWRRWEARTGHAILERYGMTEAGMIASNPYEGERRPGTVGFALPGVEVRVADEDGAALPAGEVGGVEVRGPNLFHGYWRMPEKTAEEMRPDGFFRTGDLGRLDAEGRLEIVGRVKDLIISGGLNVYPSEVEAAIDALDGVAESAVVGLPHPDLGEGVAAVVVREDGATLDEAALIAGLGTTLAGYKRPKTVTFLDELPRNAMGKIQKAALRERLAGTFR